MFKNDLILHTIPLPQNRRDEEALTIVGGCVAERFGGRKRFTHLIDGENILHVEGMDHRFNSVGGDLGQLVHQVYDLRKFNRKGWEGFVRDT